MFLHSLTSYWDVKRVLRNEPEMPKMENNDQTILLQWHNLLDLL